MRGSGTIRSGRISIGSISLARAVSYDLPEALRGLCQTNANTFRAASEGSQSGGKKGAPLGESSVTVGLEVLSAVEMALGVEMVEDRGVDRDELL